MAWYNTYRPKTFEDVIGQDLIKKIMVRTLEANQVKHAYLLSGSRGVGKTTLARIFANELNNTKDNPQAEVDIVELDAASNTGIDDIRVLRESAQVPPIAGAYKVFIIDEVHMLSKAAMNALLKILEEPPHYLVFLLATTNPEKILPTVLSRLIKLPLESHTVDGLITKLKQIAENEKITVEEGALSLIAKRANGSQRDAINTFETLAGYGLENITESIASELLGLVPKLLLEKLSTVLATADSKQVMLLVDELNQLNSDPYQFLDQALNYYLEQSLIHNDQHPELIHALASVLDLQYPIASNFQAVALIYSYYTPSNSTANEKKTLEPVAQKSAPKKDLSQEITPQQTVPEPEKNKAKQSTEVKTEITKQTEEQPHATHGNPQLAQAVNELLDRSDKPNSLKMIPDLQVRAGEDGSVILTTAVGMFVPSLKSAVVTEWVQSALKEYNPKIILVVEQAAVMKEQKTTKAKPPPVLVENKQDIHVPESPKKNSKHSETIFYTVYNKLPTEGDTTNLKVRQGAIPDPVGGSSSEKSFDDHVDELFELE